MITILEGGDLERCDLRIESFNCRTMEGRVVRFSPRVDSNLIKSHHQGRTLELSKLFSISEYIRSAASCLHVSLYHKIT